MWYSVSDHHNIANGRAVGLSLIFVVMPLLWLDYNEIISQHFGRHFESIGEIDPRTRP